MLHEPMTNAAMGGVVAQRVNEWGFNAAHPRPRRLAAG